MKTYRPNNRNYIYTLVGFGVILMVLTFSLYTETDFLDSNRNLGLSGFWLFLILLSSIPVVFKIEVDKGFVRSYFLGNLMVEANSINLKSVQYKSVKIGFYGSIKVLKVSTKSNSFFKNISIGEQLYGKGVINQVMEALK